MNARTTLTRRQILQTGAAALGFPAIIPASALGKAGRPAPSGRVAYAVIGLGSRGTDVMKSFLQDERVQILAVCDVERESDRYNQGQVRKHGNLGREPGKRTVDQAYGNQDCKTYEDFRELLARDDIDAVQISTPDHWHALQAIAAARAKKHTYCEKPLSLTVAEGRKMCEVVNESGVIWQTGSQQRSDIHFRMACEFVRNGRIGKVNTIRVGLATGNRDNNGCASRAAPEPVPAGLNYDMWLGPAPDAPFCPARLHSNWRWIYDYSGGNLTDFGAHHLDIAQWALDAEHGGPVEFSGFQATWPPKGELYNTPPTFSFECRYASGVRMIVADQMEFGSGVQFEGEGGTIMVTRGGLKVTPDSARVPLGENDVHLFESKDHSRNFIDAIVNGTPTAAPIDIAYRTVTIAHLGNIGLRLGRKTLRWDPQKEQVIDDPEAQAMLTRPMRGPWQI